MAAEYYRSCFPAQTVVEWIGPDFGAREIGVQAMNPKTKKEYQQRGIRLDSAVALVQTLRSRAADLLRVDLGAVFDTRLEHEDEVVGSELKFDLDQVNWRCDRCVARGKTMPPDQQPSCEQCCWFCRSNEHAICQACWSSKMKPQLVDLYDCLRHKTDLAEGLTMFFSGGKSPHVWGARPGHRLFFASAGQRRAILTRVKDLLKGASVLEIDEGVLLEPNHFLRFPFTIHKASGRVCVPLDPDSRLEDVFVLPTETDKIKSAAGLLRPAP